MLVMHTDVLSSIVSLRKTVKELSAKTDKTVMRGGPLTDLLRPFTDNFDLKRFDYRPLSDL